MGKTLLFAAGTITGFGLTVFVNFFAKLVVTATIIFAAGYLVGRYWRRLVSYWRRINQGATK